MARESGWKVKTETWVPAKANDPGSVMAGSKIAAALQDVVILREAAGSDEIELVSSSAVFTTRDVKPAATD